MNPISDRLFRRRIVNHEETATTRAIATSKYSVYGARTRKDVAEAGGVVCQFRGIQHVAPFTPRHCGRAMRPRFLGGGRDTRNHGMSSSTLAVVIPTDKCRVHGGRMGRMSTALRSRCMSGIIRRFLTPGRIGTVSATEE